MLFVNVHIHVYTYIHTYMHRYMCIYGGQRSALVVILQESLTGLEPTCLHLSVGILRVHYHTWLLHVGSGAPKLVKASFTKLSPPGLHINFCNLNSASERRTHIMDEKTEAELATARENWDSHICNLTSHHQVSTIPGERTGAFLLAYVSTRYRHTWSQR